MIALASPNDPTGELLAAAELERLLDGLPDGVAVLLDESLVEFADAQPTNASLGAAGARTRACSCSAASRRPGGWRACASAMRSAAPARSELLAELEPDLGVSELSQAGALEALHSCSEHRRAARARRSARSARAVTEALRAMGSR